MHSQPIASIQFADGATRLVNEDEHGQHASTTRAKRGTACGTFRAKNWMPCLVSDR